MDSVVAVTMASGWAAIVAFGWVVIIPSAIAHTAAGPLGTNPTAADIHIVAAPTAMATARTVIAHTAASLTVTVRSTISRTDIVPTGTVRIAIREEESPTTGMIRTDRGAERAGSTVTATALAAGSMARS